MLPLKVRPEMMGSDYSEEDFSLTLGKTFPLDCLNTEWATGDAQLETAVALGKSIVDSFCRFSIYLHGCSLCRINCSVES